MIKRLLTLCFIVTPLWSLAQSGTVKGKVTDAATGEALIGTTVVVQNTTKGSISDLQGNFVITDVDAGEQVLSVSYVGYEKVTKTVTVVANETVDIGDFALEDGAVGLKEVEIFASVVEDRKTPVAVTSVNAQVLQERYEGVSVAGVVQNSPGVYAIQGAGGYGDQEVYIRGFDQSNVAFLVNGIPVNDMENGRMFWSNFAGLSEVTRQIQVQRGLGASKLAISSIGGTVNMITKPSEKSEGGAIEYQTGTGSWNQRLRFSYNTGESENGWAVSFQGSRTTTDNGFIGLGGEGQGAIVPGAFTDAWAYYLAVSKTINPQHQVMFWAFGAPVNRGTAWIVDDATRDAFDIDEPIFNNALGIYNGELFNARQNKVNKPLMALSHYWDIDVNTSINTSIYFSHANVYSAQPNDAENSTFFPERFLREDVSDELILAGNVLTPDNLIDWDYLATQNRTEERFSTIENPNGDPYTDSITGYESQYFLEARFNNHNWIGLISNFKKSKDNLNLLGGIDLRYYKGLHYAEVFELFGGDFVLNKSSFDDDYNKLQPNGIAKKGDRTNYDYDGIVRWAAAFGQAEYNLDKLNIFASATLTNSWYTRIGNFWNSRDIYNLTSLGESETKSFTTYTAKAGANYRFNNRHNVFANVGRFTRPPFFRNSFSDARYSNEFRQGLTTEKIFSTEAGYGFRSSILKVNINGYYLTWKDRTTEFGVGAEEFQDLDQELPIVLNGLVSEHKGLELDFTYNVTTNLELSGFAGLGDWEWKEAPAQTVSVGGETRTFDELSDLVGLPVGTAAQTTAGMGLHYSGIRDTYVGGRWNYFDRIPISYSPEDVVDGFIDREVIENGFPDYSTFSLYAGRYFDLSDEVSGKLSISVQNVFDAEYVRWASYFFQQTSRAFGYPRTYTIGLSIQF